MSASQNPVRGLLLDVLAYRASESSGFADRPAFTYLDDGETVSRSLTFRELSEEATKLGGYLRGLTEPGDRVLLAYPPSLDYVIAFYACLYAGLIAVPTVSPSNARTASRLHAMWADCSPRLALTHRSAITHVEGVGNGSPTSWIATDDLDPALLTAEGGRARIYGHANDDIAFLQYTSGSTGTPKGVMVTQGNLSANVDLITGTYGIRAGDTFVFWLPPHHDFGLVAATVLPVWAGTHCVQFPPAAFLRRPVQWLKLIGRYRARVTGAPNFAYQICVDQISDEALAGVDLGSLEIAANGAERIRPGTLRAFAERFARWGFRQAAFAPSYGMAETVLLATASPGPRSGAVETRWVRTEGLGFGRAEPAAPGPDAVETLRTGELSSDDRVTVVDPNTHCRLPDGRVGEIWIRGASVATGYWGNDEQTRETFKATLADEPEAGYWLRSGDLGFAAEGGLYVTGRAKEVMIVGGRNVYPQDVEVTVEALDPAFRANGCAVFSLEDEATTRIVVVQEVQARAKPVTSGLVARLRRALAEDHELFDLAAILLVRGGRLPRTSSGKIQRNRCRMLFEQDEIESVWSWRYEPDEASQPRSARMTRTEEIVAGLWRDVFGRADLAVEADFFVLGGTSLAATRIMAGLHTAFGLELSPTVLYAHSTIAALAREVDAHTSTSADAGARLGAPEPVPTDRAPLSFNQERLWILDQIEGAGSDYTIAAAFCLEGTLDRDRLAHAVGEIAERHDILRTTIQGDEEPWQALGDGAGLTVVDLSCEADPTAAARRAVEEDTRSSVGLAEGPLTRTSLYVLGPDRHILSIVAHHIVFDGWSLAIYLDELRQIYNGAEPAKPAFQYRDYAVWQRALATNNRLEPGLRYWREMLTGAACPTALPLDRPRQSRAGRRGDTVGFELSPELEKRFVRHCADARVSIFAVLAAGLNVLLNGFEDQRDVSIGYPVSGRNRAEWSNVIGFFANTLVLRTRMGAQETFASLLGRVQETLLQNAANDEVPFEKIVGALKPARDAPWSPLFQVFLSLFDADGLVGPEGLRLQGLRDTSLPIARDQAKFDLSFEFTQTGGRLNGLVEYDTELFDATTVRRLADTYVAVLDAALTRPEDPLADILARARTRIDTGWAEPIQGDSAVAESLPPPAASLESEAFVAPRGGVEEMVAQIWAELLGVTRVGAGDDFFELGGHSLLATRVVSRLRRDLQIEVPVRALFEAPTLAAFAARIDSERAPSAPPIAAAPRDGTPAPASFAQERLFFLSQLAPDATAYTVAVAVRLRGPLDIDALGASLAQVAARHDALRTTLVQDERGAVLASVHRDLPELEQAGPFESLEALTDHARDFADEPFHLGEGPLLRARLLRLSEEDHTLVLAMHHAVVDGWSLGVLVGEIEAAYEALAVGGEPALPPLPVQYADYARWQRAWLSGEELERQTAYWRRQLADARTVLELPADRVRPPVPSHRGALLVRPLGRELSERVDRLGRRLGATPFMVLFAAFSVLLGRFAGQEDVVVGTPIANRTRAETEPLVGLFINTLALRTRLHGNPRFDELVEQVRTTTLQAYANQDLPFEKVVEALGVPRDMSRAPVFQTMFQLQNAPMPALSLPGIDAQPMDLGRRTAKFDLTLEATPTDDGYLARWEYATDLFDEDTVARMADGFERLIQQILDKPDAPIGSLSLLRPETERQFLAADQSASGSDLPVHRRFEETARRKPDAIAIVCGENNITYRELDARADEIAAALVAAGAGPETGIGICMGRSIDLVAALLGTWKAGAYYIPMDPAYPAERLLDMLAIARCRMVLVDEAGAGLRLPAGAEAITLDTGQAPRPTAIPHWEGHPDGCAYTIFTSGSTGRPKGVQVTHKALSAFLAAMATEPGLHSDDVLLAVTSISFDIAGLELLLPLVEGSRVVLAQREDTFDGRRLLELVRTHRVTIMQATPATYRLMLAAGWPTSVQIKCLCGGEAMPPELARELRPRTTSLWNMYGPTETTIWSTVSRVTETAPRIGRPIAGTVVRVLDPNGALCPIGVPGELHIGGAGLARGYVERPDLTAERFVPDPHATSPGARLYRTGDLVVWRADGELDFIGRIDNQVKIRGFRIELGEIEIRLSEYPGVRQAVVVAARERKEESAGSDVRLAAFVVAEENAVAVADLREFIAGKLPGYMIPTQIVRLAELPLTPNGKVDRKALERLAAEGCQAPTRSRTPPASPRELAVAELWRSVLGVEDVAREDNFFEHGGHSLLAAHVVEMLRSELGLPCTLQDFFEAQTLAAFTARLERADSSAPDRSTHLVELRPGLRPVFLFHALSGSASPYRDLAASFEKGLRVLAFEAGAVDDASPAQTRIELLGSRYADEAAARVPEGPVPLVGWSMGALLAFEAARRLEAAGRRVDPLILIDPPSAQPGMRTDPEPWYLGYYLRELARERGGEAEAEFLRMGNECAGDDERFLAFAREIGVIPPALPDALVHRRAALFERNHRAMLAYRPGGAIRSSLILLCPEGAGPAPDWQDWALGGVTVEYLPGDHYTILHAAGRAIQARIRNSASDINEETLPDDHAAKP